MNLNKRPLLFLLIIISTNLTGMKTEDFNQEGLRMRRNNPQSNFSSAKNQKYTQKEQDCNCYTALYAYAQEINIVWSEDIIAKLQVYALIGNQN